MAKAGDGARRISVECGGVVKIIQNRVEVHEDEGWAKGPKTESLTNRRFPGSQLQFSRLPRL